MKFKCYNLRIIPLFLTKHLIYPYFTYGNRFIKWFIKINSTKLDTAFIKINKNLLSISHSTQVDTTYALHNSTCIFLMKQIPLSRHQLYVLVTAMPSGVWGTGISSLCGSLLKKH
jgi:hypothetical protein